MRHSAELQCDVSSLTYDFNMKRGFLIMDDGNCCDMQACITLFLRIDPHVSRIDTVAGDVRDTFYVLTPKGWGAYDGETGPESDQEYWTPRA